ncbi:MAG TPA: hypothetical protein VEH30_16455 [Terriglobales bacterium]|nr:hypothetical protein [Terriglobales bacterium]
MPEPVVPLSPEQMPASPPQVAFSGGILTITANNATLGDILRAVHRQTGAAVDVPGNATERVVGIFGPGPVRDVMTLLLNGSHFNYVLLGSATDPGALEKVVLISKSTGMEPVSQSNVAASQFRTASNVPQAAENADASTDDAAEMPQEAGDAVEDQANQSQPEEQQQPQQANPFGQRGGVKTPEQLLQELQQRQQQMQQQQQQQGSPQSLPPAPTGAPQQSQPQ